LEPVRKIRLHDTLRGSVIPLEPREPGRVGIYACGPTVYGRVHVGNARPFVVFALLKRFLEHEGYDTTFVANITDVNDKIYDAARERDVASADLAGDMTAAYIADTDGLGLGRPDSEPRATETIGPIVELIEDLVESGHAYEARGDVYFRVASYPGYGKLSNRPLEEMQQGEGDDATELKEAPQDFALWKARKEGEDTFWPSPWGEGRPGWHIECSAMAEEILGVDFEVHGGGSDLVFPHHENEIAQTEAARGKPLARVWMHNGMVEMDAEKMAKSVGNIRLLHGALEEFGREAFVMWIVGAHYRKPVAYTEEALAEASRAADRIRELGRRLEAGAEAPGIDEYAERFFDALADDFNTPQARAILFDWVTEANRRLDAGETLGPGRLGEMLHVLGLESLLEGADEEVPDELRRLAEEREEARAARDFERADAIRDQLAEAGWQIRDTPEGAKLVPLGSA
jgi:cysteinyl-tRNA synthetase